MMAGDNMYFSSAGLKKVGTQSGLAAVLPYACATA